MEPIRQALRACFGAFATAVAVGLELRHDHGSQFVADDFQRELAFKENLLWVRRFDSIEQLMRALHVFEDTYNRT